MVQISRRVLLVLTGLFIAGAINQRFEASSTKELSQPPAPKPPNQPTETSKDLTPTPPEKEVPDSTNMIDKETTTQPSKKSLEETSPPENSESEIEDGVVIAKSSDLILRQTKVFYLKDSFGISTGYSLTRTSRGIVAFDTRCTHAGVPSVLNGTQLECPAHGSIFDPESGQVLSGPAVEPLRSYPTFEVNGEIRIVIS